MNTTNRIEGIPRVQIGYDVASPEGDKARVTIIEDGVIKIFVPIEDMKDYGDQRAEEARKAECERWKKALLTPSNTTEYD